MSDHTITSLFSVKQVLERVGELHLTGCLHVFRDNHSGNIYLKEGLVTAASFQQQFDRPAIHSMVEGRGFHLMWLSGQETQFPNLKLPVETLLGEPSTAAPRGLTPPPIAANAAAPNPREVASSQDKLKTSRLPASGDIQPAPPVAPEKCAFYLQRVDDHRIILLDRDGLIMGRDNNADITVDDASVSRRHCALRFDARGIHLMDLHSTNGIFIGTTHVVGEGVVSNGDTFTLGQISFRVHRHEIKPLAAPISLGSSRNGIPATPA